MRRLAALLVAPLLAGFALSACDAQFTPYAARVDGSSVSQSTLDGALDSVSSDPGYACLVGSASGASGGLVGAAPGTYSAAFTASALSLLVQAQALRVAAAHMDVTVTPLGEDIARQELIAGFNPAAGSSCTSSGLSVYSDLSGDYRNALLTLQGDEDALAARAEKVALTPAGVTAYETAHRSSTTLNCIEVIEVATQAKAKQLAFAINGGVSFSSVATKNSLDATSAGNGGSLGCILPATLVSPLGPLVGKLGLRTLSAPVAFHSDWLLLEVTSRSPAPLDEAATAIVHLGSGAATKIVDHAVSSAAVTIDPAYGTWTRSQSTYSVRPPDGPPLNLVPNPSAVGLTTSSPG